MTSLKKGDRAHVIRKARLAQQLRAVLYIDTVQKLFKIEQHQLKANID